MHSGRFTSFVISLLLLLLVAVSACQKDPDPSPTTTVTTRDTVKTVVIANPHGNYLAASGMLTIKIKDSTYIFDASRDSVAFINVNTSDSNKYFGITAINKEHTISFGISSSGFAGENITGAIAGSQFILSPNGDNQIQQYSLSRYSGQKNFGKINITQYNKGSVLAKGTFVTFLATDDKVHTPFYRVEGTFDLQLK